MIPDTLTLSIVESSVPPTMTLSEHRRERSSWGHGKRPKLLDVLAGWWKR